MCGGNSLAARQRATNHSLAKASVVHVGGDGGGAAFGWEFICAKTSASVSCLLCARKDVSAGAAGLRAFASRVCALIILIALRARVPDQ